MPSLGIAPLPGVAAGTSAACRRGGTGYRRLSGGCPNCTFWRLDFRQSSFRHITRTSRHAVPYAWTRQPVSWHAIFPGYPFEAG